MLETYYKVDGSIVFNLHKKNSLAHSGLSVYNYYSELDSLWKEFDGLINMNGYTYDVFSKLNDHSKLMKLMQFLSVLDGTLNHVKSQTLFGTTLMLK